MPHKSKGFESILYFCTAQNLKVACLGVYECIAFSVYPDAVPGSSVSVSDLSSLLTSVG